MRLSVCPFVAFLDQDEQMFVRSFSTRRVVNGPGSACVPICAEYERRNAVLLDSTQSVLLRDEYTGNIEMHTGPALHFMTESEVIHEERDGNRLSNVEYLKVRNQQTGEYTIVKGPTLYFLKPLEEIVQRGTAWTLSSTQYLHVKNSVDGNKYTVRGPTLFFPTADEVVDKELEAISLKKCEYVKIIDAQSGQIRVEVGEQMVTLEPTEKTMGSPARGVNVDDSHAVLIRKISTGELHLITEHQVYIPSADEEIVDVRSQIRLEAYNACVVKDGKTGNVSFVKGPTKFFLQPHCELYTWRWSSGIHKDKRSLELTILDMRACFMWFALSARTSDNVELSLALTFYWKIADIETMFRTTGDASGDICSRARSQVIDSVSKISLETFLTDFNERISVAVLQNKDFFKERGIEVRAVEVRSVDCKDPSTQEILQNLIRSNTNRLTQINMQASENEIALKRCEGERELAKMKTELLQLEKSHAQTLGETQGLAESTRLRAFFEGLPKDVTSQDAMILFQTLRKAEALEQLSNSKGAKLYLTPTDVNMRMNMD